MKAPPEYFELTAEQLKDICNGCGPKGWGWIVPDRLRLIGVNFEEPCRIHDACYHIGMDKKEADNLF